MERKKLESYKTIKEGVWKNNDYRIEILRNKKRERRTWKEEEIFKERGKHLKTGDKREWNREKEDTIKKRRLMNEKRERRNLNNGVGKSLRRRKEKENKEMNENN